LPDAWASKKRGVCLEKPMLPHIFIGLQKIHGLVYFPAADAANILLQLAKAGANIRKSVGRPRLYRRNDCLFVPISAVITNLNRTIEREK
jgi:hypothetical protein